MALMKTGFVSNRMNREPSKARPLSKPCCENWSPNENEGVSMTVQSLTSGTSTSQPAAQSGRFVIGGDLPVHRLGFGAMQITGPGVWGEPRDHDEAIAVLRRVIELGINL